MALSSSPSLLLLVAVLLLSSSLTAAQARLLLSTNPCSKTRDPALCNSLLNSATFDSPTDLELAIIKQAMAEVISAKAEAEKAMNSASDARTKAFLNNCKGFYGNALDDLQSAVDYLKGEGSEMDIETNIEAALTDVGTCSSEWEESGMKDFPLEKVDKRLNSVVGIVFDLSRGLEGVNHKH